MRITLLSLFCTFNIFFVSAQNPKLEVKINSISTYDIHQSAVEYQINYHIENKTTNELSFFLIPNALIAHAAGSMTLFAVYKIYQNGVFEDMDGPFFEYETEDQLNYAKIQNKESEDAKKIIKEMQTAESLIATDYYQNYKANGGESDDFQWIYQRQRLLNNVIVLKPNETRNLVTKTLWNKNRYIKNEALEYYLDEKNNIELELIVDLKTNLFKDQLSTEDLRKINENPNFIQGYFKSNKMKIEFKD